MTAYPIALPTTPNFRDSTFATDSAVSVSESPFSFEQQVYVHQGQRWKFNGSLPPMRRASAEQWCAAMVSLNGRQGTFLMGDPDAKLPRGSVPGIPLVNGPNQTGGVLASKGWTINRTGILLAGDYIQLGLGGTSRLYKVLADVNSDGSGHANIPIWPNLRVPPSDGDSIFTSNCRTLFRLDANWTWDADKVSTYGMKFSATEAL